jgi:hypothetical protein
MDSLFSFPVGLFHPLQHAGLSRRTPSSRPTGSNQAQVISTFENGLFTLSRRRDSR